MRVLVLVTFLLAASQALAANEECWSRGYRDGWCDGKGLHACNAGRTPPPPAAPAGQDDCDSRYVDGYVAGQKAGMPPKAN